MVRSGPAVDVVGAYIDFVARHEQDQYMQRDSSQRIMLAAQHLGRGCHALVMRHNKHVAQSQFRSAQRILGLLSHPSSTGADRDAASILSHTATILKQHGQPGSVAQTLTSLQTENARQIRGNLERSHPSPQGRNLFWRGQFLPRVVEESALGALLRIRDPRYLGLQALPHHEHDTPQGQRSHFDATFSMATGAVACTQKLQVKSACLGFCRYPDAKAVERRDDYRGQYDNDIMLISGCCDLGIRKEWEGTHNVRTARLLMKEVDGEAGSRDRAALDTISSGMLDAIISCPTERRGLLPAGGGAVVHYAS
jgi:hypothetical protein